jgi:hypothetical protein
MPRSTCLIGATRHQSEPAVSTGPNGNPCTMVNVFPVPLSASNGMRLH